MVSCIERLPRNKTLRELSKVKRQTVEAVFRDFASAIPELPDEAVFEPEPGPSGVRQIENDSEIEEKIRNIIDMFPHLGDGECLIFQGATVFCIVMVFFRFNFKTQNITVLKGLV